MSHISYFLGANSPGGFFSLYPELIRPQSARAIYILKGGPGCGKSTLMRRVAAAMEDHSLAVEYILCSGDPDSLDAILIPELGVALVDGTAPHVVEPKYPGAVERYVNLGCCYDADALYPLRESIMECMSRYQNCYPRAYRCLAASAAIEEDLRSCVLTEELQEKLTRRAKGILSREVGRRKTGTAGLIRQRFLDGITHKGELCLFETATAQCPRIFALADTYGLAHDLLIPLLTGAAEAGYEAIACPDPMAPDRLRHLLIPEAGVAFLTSSPSQPFPGTPARRIRLDAAADPDVLRQNRARFRFSRRVSAALKEEAIASLAQAKELHDQLEAIYNPHVDFEKVSCTAETISEEILSFAD